jgi:protein-arginine kinase activator protein McsA
MICELCRYNEATLHIRNSSGELFICNKCNEALQTSLGFYIAGNEVVKEEYDSRTDKN